ncbi:MAG: excinuclease ABC subunit B, partial [Staphylococcus epidermidis]|nr:excinuclease ABC subunit B [Staphylococcus epidermidis]
MLCENCHFNEAEVKLTVKGIDSTHEKWVCSVCAQGENPWLHS